MLLYLTSTFKGFEKIGKKGKKAHNEEKMNVKFT